MTGLTGTELVEALQQVELATIGHFLDTGFCSPRIRAIGQVPRVAGPAVTVDLVTPDALAVNHAILRLQPGSVLVVRVASQEHAPIGAVTRAAALAQGAAGIVVDGPVTDIDVLTAGAGELPVWATGSTARTTKRLGSSVSQVGATITVGGAEIREGAIVAGDCNGVLVADELDRGVLEAARASDAAEPRLLERIRNGEPLATLIATERTES